MPLQLGLKQAAPGAIDVFPHRNVGRHSFATGFPNSSGEVLEQLIRLNADKLL